MVYSGVLADTMGGCIVLRVLLGWLDIALRDGKVLLLVVVLVDLLPVNCVAAWELLSEVHLTCVYLIHVYGR
jgi:hypothetical protein